MWVYARRGYVPGGRPVRQKTFADDVRDLQAVLAAIGGEAQPLGEDLE